MTKARAEMERRNTAVYSRKLFSVYRYKKVTRSANPDGANWDLSANKAKEDSSAIQLNSCTHYYNRNLSPIRENFQLCNPKTPYRQNF